MDKKPEEVLALSGDIYYAPIGTTAPTGVETALAVAWVNLGYVSEDGATQESVLEKTSIKDWAGSTIKTIKENAETTFTFKLIQVGGVDAQKFVYGEDNVTVTPATATEGNLITVTLKDDVPNDVALVLDMWDSYNADSGAKRGKRIHIPRASITSRGEIAYKYNEVTGYEVTVTALADETAGYSAKTIISDGALTP